MNTPGDIISRIDAIRATLPTGVGLVAVSKFHPLDAVLEAARAGQRMFGESRVQELQQKVAALGEMKMAGEPVPPEVDWHFIGHLQTNKVRQLLRLRPAMIESVDSERLLELIDREAQAQGIVQRVLLQVHVAKEETKTGFLPEELFEYFRRRGFETLKATHICGVMGMASNTDDEMRVAADFRRIRSVFDEISRMCPDLRGFDTVSMGMSGDYLTAVAEGSTLVRVGTAIFGGRSYH